MEKETQIFNNEEKKTTGFRMRNFFVGRVCREHYRLFFILFFAYSIIFSSVEFYLQGGAANILSVFFLFLYISFGFRRLHDLGYYGWIILIPGGIFLLFHLFDAIFDLHLFSIMAFPLSAALLFILWVNFMFVKGNENPNHYGNPPGPSTRFRDVLLGIRK